ncbi:hypothetical protein SHIRM173S_01878 [Streptomyces hirsutus]
MLFEAMSAMVENWSRPTLTSASPMVMVRGATSTELPEPWDRAAVCAKSLSVRPSAAASAACGIPAGHPTARATAPSSCSWLNGSRSFNPVPSTWLLHSSNAAPCHPAGT